MFRTEYVFNILSDYCEGLEITDVDLYLFAEAVSMYLLPDKLYSEEQICKIAKELYELEKNSGNLDTYSNKEDYKLLKRLGLK